MPFKKGDVPNPNGRGKGTENELTKKMKSVKQTIMDAFNELQLDKKANIIAWGKENPRDFYNIASKLIPTEIEARIIKYGKDAEEEEIFE